MKNFAVIGSPIKHSLSPLIHQLFAEQCLIGLHYRAIEALSVELFRRAVKDFFQQTCAWGMNITIPFKAEAFKLVTDLNQEACDTELRLAESVNTLWLNADRQLVGASTDGYGLVTDLVQNIKMNLVGKSILILGAGGAASGILTDLIRARPGAIYLANRNYDKAKNIVNRFNQGFICKLHDKINIKLDAIKLESLTEPLFDLIINATSISLSHQDIPFNGNIIKHSVVYDMAYDLMQPTYFNQWAQKNQAEQVFDGIGMLVEQAAESFQIWHGIKPDTCKVLDKLKKF